MYTFQNCTFKKYCGTFLIVPLVSDKIIERGEYINENGRSVYSCQRVC